MVKIGHLDDSFLVKGQYQQRKEKKRKGEKRKEKKSKIEKAKDVGHLLIQKLKILISAHARAQSS